MNVTYTDDDKKTHDGTLNIINRIALFKTKEFHVLLQNAEVLSFGSAEDDFGIVIVGYELINEHAQSFKRKVVVFYPDLSKMTYALKNK